MANVMMHMQDCRINVTLRDSIDGEKAICIDGVNYATVVDGRLVGGTKEEITLFVTEDQAAQIADSLFGQVLVMKAKKAVQSNA